MSVMYMPCTTLLTQHPVSHVAQAQGYSRRVPSLQSHARSRVAAKSRTWHCAPPHPRAPYRRGDPRCSAQGDVDPETVERQAAGGQNAAERGAAPPGAAPGLEAALKDVNSSVIVGGSWALYGVLIGVSVVFTGNGGAGGQSDSAALCSHSQGT